MNINLPVIAGTIATTLFAISTLPMVVKAYRTKDLKSYSLGYLVLGNAGNIFYSIYVYNMPPGPIWLLHSFYLIVTGLMLFWYLRYEGWPRLQKHFLTNQPLTERANRSVLPIHKPIYPIEIPRSGHDGAFLISYAGSVMSNHTVNLAEVRAIMSQQNKALTRRVFEELENQGNLVAVDEIFARDFVNHTPFGEVHGTEGAKQFVTMLRSAFPDLHTTIEDQVAEGDKVATRWTAQGTHRGAFQGVPPTGREINITGMAISRIANGKIVEQWGNPDVLGIMQQIGVVPQPERAR